MITLFREALFKTRTDRVVVIALLLSMLALLGALKLNDYWAEQRNLVSPSVIGTVY